MPIPTPKKSETKDQFITRCMSSDVMKTEFPENAQRFAVCNSKWETRGKTESSENEKEEEKNGRQEE